MTPTLWRGEFRINPVVGRSHQQSAVTALPDGHFVVAFAESGAADPNSVAGWRVDYRVYDTFGAAASNAIPVASPTPTAPPDSPRFQLQPAVTALTDGRFAVGWLEAPEVDEVNPASTTLIERGVIRSVDGTAEPAIANRALYAFPNGSISAATYIFSDDSSFEFGLNLPRAEVVALPEGRFGLGASDFRAYFTGADETVTLHFYDGAALPTGDTEITPRGPSSSDPDFVRLGNGNYVVAFERNELGGNTSDTVMFSLFRGDNAGIRTEVQVSIPGGQHRIADPTVFGLHDNGFVVAWRQKPAESSPDADDRIVAHVYDQDGMPVGGEFFVNEVVDGRQTELAGIGLQDGRFLVAWRNETAETEIVGRVFTATGSPDSNEFRINTTTAGLQYAPQLAELADGRVVVTWTDESASTDDPAARAIRAQIVDPRNGPINFVGTVADDLHTGTSKDDTLAGGDGNDALTGEDGNDLLNGGNGNDTLEGGAGQDTLDGGFSFDVLSGGDGDDVYVVGDSFDTIQESLNAGVDTVQTIREFYVLPANVENLKLVPGYDSTPVNWIGNVVDNRIEGTASPDTIDGFEGNDTIQAGGGDDSLNAGLGEDEIHGGAGNDTIGNGLLSGPYIPGVYDRFFGEAGDDTFTASFALELIAGGDGFDVVSFEAQALTGSGLLIDLNVPGPAQTVVRGDTYDSIEGFRLTALADTISGRIADDVIYGLGGNDNVSGAAGNDTVYGGDGDDTLIGGTGIDRLEGGEGSDVYLVDNPSDIAVEPLQTVMVGIDEVRSTVSYSLDLQAVLVENLTLLPGSGAIVGRGNALSNRLVGNTDANRLEGLVGSDTLLGGGGNDTLDGGSGFDLVDLALATTAVTLNLAAGTASFAGSGDALTLIAVEAASTSSGADLLTGDAAANSFLGGGGADTIFAGGGDDTLGGGDGADTLQGHADVFAIEANVIAGDAGDDTLFAAFGDAVTGGTGRDVLYQINDRPWSVNLGTASIEYMRAGFGADTIDGGSQTAGIEVYAGGGNDLVTGSALADRIYGDSGNDTVAGGDGNDVILGDVGQDSLSGGAGDDTMYVDAFDTFIDGADGRDAAIVTGVSGNPGLSLNLATAHLEYVADFAGNPDALDGSGTSAALEVYAGLGADTVTGGSGADFLWGEGGADRVSGNGGGDTLVGGGGADTLIAGAGIDTVFLNYGSGSDGASDVVILAPNSGTDIIFDFVHGQDKIDITAYAGLSPTLSIASNGPHAYATLTYFEPGDPNPHFAFLASVANNAGQLQADDFLL